MRFQIKKFASVFSVVNSFTSATGIVGIVW